MGAGGGRGPPRLRSKEIKTWEPQIHSQFPQPKAPGGECRYEGWGEKENSEKGLRLEADGSL